jgi:hypothetical protein
VSTATGTPPPTPPPPSAPGGNVIEDTWRRFLAHWSASTFGFFLRSLLPVIVKWTNPKEPVSYPRWWAALLFAALICLLAGGINSNLPAKPSELVKSVGLGFALDVATLLAKFTPLPP